MELEGGGIGEKKMLDETNSQTINISINGEELDGSINKANRLVELLKEASELICSLSSGTKDQ